ncbi:MAG: phosphoribosyltransferase [Flavobacterium sp.]|nr:phosphoribosyltransferase [Flavobacterium sp.]
MKYPIEIEKRIPEIESIITKWPVKRNIEEVINWILQFDTDDFDLAFRIIRNLNVIGPENLNSALSISYSKLMRYVRNKGINLSLKNTLYASIGGASKSGSMISYNFRLINELSSANFLDEKSIIYLEERKIDNLVLVDDIIASGEQSSKGLVEIAEKVLPLGVKNIFVLTAVGFKFGIKKVQDTGLAYVFSALEYDEKDSIISLDSKFYDGLTYSQRKATSEKLSSYKGTGYGNIGALIAFYYNTPNCTLNCIWTDNHGWIPLFPRISNVSGIDKHYPELEVALTKKQDDKPKSSFTIFVEGKIDEIFFEELGKKYDKFGFENFDVISIGPFYSKKLIDSLKLLSEKYALIVEKEEFETGHSRKVKEVVDSDSLIIMDKMICYFDLEKILKSEYFENIIDKDIFEKDPENVATYLDIKLLKKTSPYNREANIRELISNFLLTENANKLITEIKDRIK